ncbi:aminoacyl-histidine dipeptidase [Sedimentibacter hydroxybenzoicus DSM 7310]|uniref:Cytosol non-specific dipeptidase n=1 Tax=Sedimentibacter hydroxybenzoicus DSM 7310 TaxID=1123245 RepID=A0A974BMD6_SEDHY|nr:aminoacyl-histidine dipeptidase [Sedimentibacter hydroxybenzoicus]NYB75717.1 aminoacyl-histidine dipeptidase [Sedimentibacter hydroxybenzoicus DSM 7310]
MERVLGGLKPEKVFYYFEEISKIPRCSGYEKEISDYLYNLSISKGWEVIQDDYLNIIIKKPATEGYENAPVVMLQGHMDMVCEKNEGVQHDFSKDPIKLRIKEGCIYATETTLGADNGIAVAYALSILDSDELSHPALEVLITSDEEKGMTGADKVDGSIFKAKYLLNLDSEEEGVFTCGCAGGCGIEFKIPVKYQEVRKNCCKLSVKGLSGGHSGTDIHKEKGNANKILGRILYDLYDYIDLINITGGSKGNAIPREANAYIAMNDGEKVKDKVKLWNEILKNEYMTTDSNITVMLENINAEAEVLERDVFKKVVSAINLIPNGPLSRSTVINLIISSNNLGVITQDEKYITLHNQARSSVKSLMTEDLTFVMEQIGESLGIECFISGYYPGWEFKEKSEIRNICIKSYKDIYGKEPKVEAIHAGLECGLLMEKIQGLDAISLGPDAFDAHSPNEHVDIKSVENVYNLLISILEKIK